MTPHRRAFTLLELLLVLAIAVAVAGVAAPSLQRTLEHQQLKNTAEQLRAKCNSARIAAMKSGQIQMLRVELGGTKYYVQPWSVGDEAINASDAAAFQAEQSAATGTSAKERVLPDGITFHASESPFDTRAAEVEDTLQKFERGTGHFSRPILFYPDGSASAATLILANQRELAIELKLRSLTGTCSVGEITTLTALKETQP